MLQNKYFKFAVNPGQTSGEKRPEHSKTSDRAYEAWTVHTIVFAAVEKVVPLGQSFLHTYASIKSRHLTID